MHFRRDIRHGNGADGSHVWSKENQALPGDGYARRRTEEVNGKPAYLATVTLNFSTNDSNRGIERCDPLAPETWLSG